MALTKYNYNSFNITPVASKALAFDSDADGFTTATAGDMTLIKTLTASSSATLTFVHGSDDVVLDSTYPIYVFKFISLHPGTNNVKFDVGFRDGSTAYDATITSTSFTSKHDEAGTDQGLGYEPGRDQAQGTSFQNLTSFSGSQNDSATSGQMFLFNPSSTTFVKHFISVTNQMNPDAPYTTNNYHAGYCNVTAAIDAVQFKFHSGNIDDGTIKLYGIKDS